MALICAADIARRGYADDGLTGATRDLIRDLVFADTVESIYGSAAHSISDRILPVGTGDGFLRNRRPDLDELLDPHRDTE